MVRKLTTKIAVGAIASLMLLAICTPAFGEGPEDTFKAKCVMCHGADAAGKTPMGSKLNIPDLRSAAIKKQSVPELAEAITKGKNKMPAFDGKLSNAQINQLATYIHDLK